MSVEEGYALCPACRVVYRPGVEASRRSHFDVHGHWPPDQPVKRPAAPRPDEEAVSPQELLHAAVRRAAQLQAVVDGLDGLIDTWARSSRPDLQDAARMLRGYLERPPIYAQDDVEGAARG